jgi:hypothetical protein
VGHERLFAAFIGFLILIVPDIGSLYGPAFLRPKRGNMAQREHRAIRLPSFRRLPIDRHLFSLPSQAQISHNRR